ncbi:glycosyltransferase [Daejeonella sp.]|uniref:glycosyltransferase n=1 Tax=Daejeonella sp. TaxID=2805397 RepID=UPI0030C13CA8
MLKSPVSVALCTYNGETFITKQLDSILNQTHSPFEIIIVDDHSTDRTRDILTDYHERYPNIKLFFNDSNLGYNRNFEKAISLTTGEFICIADQDDIWYPEKIKALLENIGENWLIFSNSEMIDINDELTGEQLLPHFHFQHDYKTILFENFVTGHACLFRRELKEKIFPIPERGFYDWWISFIALYHHKLGYLDQVLTKYRVHADSVIQKTSLSNNKEVAKKNLTKQLELFSGYTNLENADRDFITRLRTNLVEKKNPLLKSLYFNLLRDKKLFFPSKKPKNIFSSLVFLYKYLKMHQR